MRKTFQENFDESSTWRVKFTDRGKEVFLYVVGMRRLSDWGLIVTLPKETHRSERQLCDQIRNAGILELYRHCCQAGFDIELESLAVFKDPSLLDCVYRAS